MGSSVSNKITTDKLVYYVNAIDPRCYSGGTSVIDVSPSKYSNGSLVNGVTYSRGSFVFDGIDDYINTGVDFSWSNAQPFTIGVLFNLDSFAFTRGIFGKPNNSFSTPVDCSGWEWRFQVRSSQLNFSYFNSGGSNMIDLIHPISIVTGQWYYAVVTWNGIISKLYVNGIPVAADWDIPGAFVNRTSNAIIGFSYGQNCRSNYFAGRIPLVQIYDKTLSDSEVYQNYKAYSRRFTLAEPQFTTFVDNGTISTSGLTMNLDAGNRNSYKPFNFNWSDISGNNNNGTLQNGAVFFYDNGGTLQFDGSNDKVAVNSGSTLNLTNQLSLEVVFRPSTSNQNSGVISKWTTGAGTNNSYLFYLGQDISTNKFSFVIQQSDGTLKFLNTAFSYFSFNWYHVVCVADGSTMRMYINGVLQPEVQTYDGTIKSTTKKLTVGGLREEDGVASFNGRVGIARVYNRPITQSEVTQNFNVTRSRYSL